MASSCDQTSRSLIQELLQCAICLGQLSETRILPCCHSFCGSCLHTHIQTSLAKRSPFQYFPSFPCPTCRITIRSPPDGINGFLKDFRLVKFKDVLESIVNRKKDDVCGICLNDNSSEPAESFCAECQKYFCFKCAGKHNSNTAFCGHFMFILSKKKFSPEQKCLSHADETGRFFCRTCDTMVCVICVLQGHHDHNIANLSSVLSSRRKNLHRQQSDLETQIRKTQSTLFHLTCLEGQLKEIYEESCLGIKKQSRKLINRITSEEKKVQKELDLEYANKRDRLFEIKEDCKDHLVSYETLQSHIGCILQHEDTQELQDRYPQLLSEVEKASTSQTDRWKTQEVTTFLRFVPGHNLKFGKCQKVELKQKSKTLEPREYSEAVRDSDLQLTESSHSHDNTDIHHNNPRGTGHAQISQFEINQTNSSSTNTSRNIFTINMDGSRNNITGASSASNSDIFSLLSTQLVSIFGGFGRSVGDLSLPYNICFTAEGKLIVAENGNRRLQIFDTDSRSVNTVASGEIIPRCVTMVTDDHIAVTDELTKSIKVYSTDGVHMKTLIPAASTLPYGLAVTQSGNFVFTDMIFENVTVMSQTGHLEQQFGAHGSSDTTFNNPGYIDCDKQDNIYVSDSSNHSIKVFDKTGNFIQRFGGYGSLNGQLKYPKAVVVDNLGRVFVADSGNDRVVVFSADGQFLQTLLVRSHGLQRPTGLACFRGEMIAVSMPDLNEVRIYKVTTL
ncbi:tripartite motif-containing protein 2-like [Gigantopelta aegis]|uniref:tripartite motif-containing protein 2-like n=1 Tax=Gigantopelta aegis TaxID=1735272 RepID=UPI001B88CB25|nr:tripartite motif-containing protein 2-like [Gigantopelta aegis]